MIFSGIKSALAPYALAIKLIIGAAIISIVFVSGCNYGQTKDQQKVLELITENNTLRKANHSYYLVEKARKERIESELSKKEALQEQVEEVVQDNKSLRAKLKESARKRDKQLKAALANPKCADLMEQNVCDLVPLP